MSKIKKSALSFPVMFQKLEEFSCDDNRFTKVKIWLMHLGENLNGSVFEKEYVDAALPTLEYIPIVGYLEENSSNEEDFSDHRYIIIKDKNGVRRKYIGSAYGVVLSSADNNAHYEDRVCDDGITRTFLVVEGVVWNMFEDSSNILNRDLIKYNSMELADEELGTYDGFEDENGLFHFTKFSFRAACILGSDYLPGMSSSTIEVQFTMRDFIKNLQSELNDKFTEFTKLVNLKTNQGGTGVMPNTDYTQTVMEQFSDISNIVKEHETIVDRWGDVISRFSLTDIQNNEAIVVDRKNNYCFYGFPFIINGDKPEVNFTNGKRKKIQYTDYEENGDAGTPEGGFDFGKHISEIENNAFTKVENANEKAAVAESEKETAVANYNQIKADYDEIKPKYDAYVQADIDQKTAELNAQKDAKFAEYEDVLTDNTEFAALKEHKDELSVDDIEKECAVLYVKVNRAKSSLTTKNGFTSAVVGVIDDGNTDNGFVATKYGNIPVGR